LGLQILTTLDEMCRVKGTTTTTTVAAILGNSFWNSTFFLVLTSCLTQTYETTKLKEYETDLLVQDLVEREMCSNNLEEQEETKGISQTTNSLFYSTLSLPCEDRF